MSIPVSIDPLGTLGADYVKNGLLLLFDATREPVGTLNSLTNFATGEAVAFSRAISSDGKQIQNERNASNASIPTILEQAKSFEMVISDDLDGEGFLRIAAFGRSGMVNSSRNTTYPQLPRHMFVWKNRNTYEIVKDSTQLLSFYFTEDSFELRDGELVDIHHAGGQTYFGDITLYGKCVLYSIRIYNRELTTAEKAQNWAIDKLKFGL